jgi:tape measure domain-containing protein
MASREVGRIHYSLKLDDDKFKGGLKSASNSAKAFGNDTEGVFSNMGSKISKVVTTSMVAIGAAIAATSVIGIKSAADMEMLRTSFDTLTGSVESGSALFKELNQFAAKTPFETTDLAQATQTMLAFGITTKDSQKYLRMLGDVSMGSKEKLSGLSLAFSQVQSTGRLMGQDLLQMINQGFNPLTIISKKTGKSMKDLKKEMEAGSISAQMVSDAFETATSEGGLFYKGMERGANTANGLASTIKDNLMMALRGIVGMTDTGDIKKGGIFYYLKEGMKSFGDFLSANSDKMNTFFGGLTDKIVIIAGKLFEFGQAIYTYVKPHLDDLFNSIEYNLIPSLKRFWDQFGDNIIQFAEFIQKAGWALLIDGLKIMANVISVLTDAIVENKEWVVILGGAFIAFKASMLVINIVGLINGITASITAAGGLIPALGLLAGTLAIPLLIAVAAGSVIFAIWKVFELIDAYNQLAQAQGELAVQESIGRQQDVIIAQMKAGKITKEEGAKRMRAITGRAVGGPVMAGTPYIVGEKGPELFVPNGSGNIIPNDKLGSSGGTTTSTVNIEKIEVNDRETGKAILALLSRNSELTRKGLSAIGA